MEEISFRPPNETVLIVEIEYCCREWCSGCSKHTGDFQRCETRWRQEHKVKEFSPIFFISSHACSHLQMKFQWKLSLASTINRLSVVANKSVSPMFPSPPCLGEQSEHLKIDFGILAASAEIISPALCTIRKTSLLLWPSLKMRRRGVSPKVRHICQMSIHSSGLLRIKSATMRLKITQPGVDETACASRSPSLLLRLSSHYSWTKIRLKQKAPKENECRSWVYEM